MILRNWNNLLIVISLAAICSALVAEFVYGLQPCELCLKQRHPYYFFIVIALIIFFIPYFYRIVMYMFVQVGAIYGIFYSIWHVGVENKLLKGPAGCSAGLSESLNTDDLKAQILSKQVISCDEVIWSFFGFSAASLNTIVLLFIFIINGLYIYKYYEKKKEIHS
tara:strand:+ start:588 stop:1082 length:495 start_codon:yes stop_codon:yes gene_type:complete